jgi:hypothetical protein
MLVQAHDAQVRDDRNDAEAGQSECETEADFSQGSGFELQRSTGAFRRSVPVLDITVHTRPV